MSNKILFLIYGPHPFHKAFADSLEENLIGMTYFYGKGTS